MNIIPRRESLKRMAVLAIGAAIQTSPHRLWSGTDPHLTFPTAPRDRIAVASWPFRKFIDAPRNKWARDPKVPGMDLTEFPAMVVKHFGIHNIEPLDEHFHSTDAAYVLSLRNAVEKAGCHVVDIPCDVQASFYDKDPAKRKVAVENGKKWVNIAVELGSPSIRTHIGGPRNVTPDIDRTAESLTQLADYGASKNIIVALENDDNFTEDPFFIVKVLDKVKNPYLRALPDFCNSMMTHDQDFNNRAMEVMFRHAYNIAHMKDEEGDDAGHFRTVDVAKCFEIAKAQGYRGCFSMEWEGNGEPFAGTQRLIDETLKYLR
ncbi:MAG: sugar phosphate isomerase/epimerase family protein [Terriglobia bacterium]